MIQSRDISIDTIKTKHIDYYKRCFKNNIPWYSIAPCVDHVDVETDEYVDDDFEIFLKNIWKLNI